MYIVPSQHGRQFIVTGANSGTGRETTARLAAAGADVIMAVRNLSKGKIARDEILASYSANGGLKSPPGTLEVRELDLADLDSIRTFASSIDQIDVLVNNAGIMAPRNRLTTVDGFEMQFGTNFLGPFALTMLLLPKLAKGSQPRVSTMSSFLATFGNISFDNLDATRGYGPYRAYSQSKLADLVFANELSKRLAAAGSRITSVIAHPGYTRTNLQTSSKNLDGRARPSVRFTFLPSQHVSRGAEPLLFASADPSALAGGYYGPSRILIGNTTLARSLPRSARNTDANRLWATAEQLTGTNFPY